MSELSEKKKIKQVIDLLHRDCRTSLEEMATMLAIPMTEVAEIIDKLEADGTILGYGARINWNNIYDDDVVAAYIELRVTPQRNSGFDRIAERIYQFPEVKSITLVSGSYDFGITVEGKNIKEVSLFVSEHLAPMESVVGTATHFVLKRYKQDGIIFHKPTKDEREVISL